MGNYRGNELAQGRQTTPTGQIQSTAFFSKPKFYLNMATLIHLHTVRGCFVATRAKLSNCHKDQISCKVSNITIYLHAENVHRPLG